MKKRTLLSLIIVLVAAQLTFAHDPRTVAKDFAHAMIVEGAGKLTISYKSLHWNEPAYLGAKKDEQVRTRLNKGIWKKIGKLDSEFDIVIGGVQVPKGSYSLGINFDANDNFSLVLVSEGKDLSIPFATAADNPLVHFLSFDVRPTEAQDKFLLEGRCGKFRSSVVMQVPYLGEHKHEDKPTERKP